MDRAVIIDAFVELGRRLEHFGEDENSTAVIDKAMAANAWFSSSDIKMAVKAIREEMLDGDKLRRWANAYNKPQSSCRVAIIMAGNIPLVGFFDLLCVLISGHVAIVKFSSKDSVMMQYVVDILHDICPTIPIEFYDDSSSIDMVIATGGDLAASHFRSRYSDIPALIRGSRHSVAVLSGKESIEQMNGLQQDIYTYNGFGCRNVSLLLVPKGWQMDIPKPKALLDMKRSNYLCDKALLIMSGIKFKDLDGALAIESCSFPDSISRVHYSYYESINDVYKWLEEHDDKLQCVVSTIVKHPRCVDFGRAQYPSLWDYADGVDVMKFLTI